MGLKGYRLWAMGQLDSTCRAPPCATPEPENIEAGGDGGGKDGVYRLLLIVSAVGLCTLNQDDP